MDLLIFLICLVGILLILLVSYIIGIVNKHKDDKKP